jgi:heterodisulfide reductase subunit C
MVDLAQSRFGDEGESNCRHGDVSEYAAESKRDIGGCIECGTCWSREYHDIGRDEYSERTILLHLRTIAIPIFVV